MFRRELLAELVRLAYETINELLSEAAGDHNCPASTPLPGQRELEFPDTYPSSSIT